MDMIVVMKASANDEDVQRVVERIRELGLTPHYGAAVTTGRTTSNPGIPSKSATLKV
jgi:hypothetical protein